MNLFGYWRNTAAITYVEYKQLNCKFVIRFKHYKSNNFSFADVFVDIFWIFFTTSSVFKIHSSIHGIYETLSGRRTNTKRMYYCEQPLHTCYKCSLRHVHVDEYVVYVCITIDWSHRISLILILIANQKSVLWMKMDTARFYGIRHLQCKKPICKRVATGRFVKT